MKVPYSWLTEWVDAPWPAAELGARLTMAGFELEALASAAPAFSGVVVAEILERRAPSRRRTSCRCAACRPAVVRRCRSSAARPTRAPD